MDSKQENESRPLELRVSHTSHTHHHTLTLTHILTLTLIDKAADANLWIAAVGAPPAPAQTWSYMEDFARSNFWQVRGALASCKDILAMCL